MTAHWLFTLPFVTNYYPIPVDVPPQIVATVALAFSFGF